MDQWGSNAGWETCKTSAMMMLMVRNPPVVQYAGQCRHQERRLPRPGSEVCFLWSTHARIWLRIWRWRFWWQNDNDNDNHQKLMKTWGWPKEDNKDLSTALARQTSCRWPELKLLPPSFNSVASSMSSPHMVILVKNHLILWLQWKQAIPTLQGTIPIAITLTITNNTNNNNNTNSLEDAVQFLLFHPLPGVEVEAERARKDHGVLPIKCLSDWRYLLATRWKRTWGTIVIDLLSCCNPNLVVSTPSKKTFNSSQ